MGLKQKHLGLGRNMHVELVVTYKATEHTRLSMILTNGTGVDKAKQRHQSRTPQTFSLPIKNIKQPLNGGFVCQLLCVNCCQLNNPSLSHPSDFNNHANNQTEVKHQQLPPASKNFNPPSSFRLSLALFN